MSEGPNDPTRSGSPLPAGTGARLSLNEIEQLCLKAARGAGMSWGIAEEAGQAAGWLAARGIDGPGALLAELREAAGRDWRAQCPVLEAGRWFAPGAASLSPIALGVALSDFAGLPEADLAAAPLSAGPVGRPVLLLPFLAALAATRGQAVRLDWDAGSLCVAAAGLAGGDPAALAGVARATVRLSLDPRPAAADRLAASLPVIGAEVIGGLDALALRTTVPPSEVSRAGAGAAASDND